MRRARISDIEYGHVCPTCASPKTPQALRCLACWRHERRAPDRVQRPTKRCACGRPMWSQSRRCRACYRAEAQSTPTPEAYRRKHRALNRLLFKAAA